MHMDNEDKTQEQLTNELMELRQRVEELEALQLRHRRVVEALRRRNNELALLHQAGRAFGTSLDIDQVLGAVLEEVRRLLGAVACSLWLTDPHTGELVCRQATGPQSDVVRGWRLAPGQGLAGWTAQNLESLVVPDLQAEERHFKGVDEKTGLALRSAISVPLEVKQKAIGVLQVADLEIGRFDTEDLRLLEPLAASAAMVIENARLFEQAQREIRERMRAEQALRKVNRALKTLSECNQMLFRATDEEDLLRGVCRILVEEGGYRLAWVGFAEQDEKRTVRPAAQAGFDAGFLEAMQITWAGTERGHDPTGTAIRTGTPAVAPNILTDANFAPWREAAIERGYASNVALPLRTNGQTIGALTVYATEPDAFGAAEVKLLAELADDLAYGIMALRTRAERQRASEALRESERRLSHLLAHLPGMAYRCRNDPDWTMEFVSEGCFDLTGYRPTDLLESRTTAFAELIHPDDRERVWQQVQNAIERRSHFQLSYRIRTARGVEKWVWEQGGGVFSPQGELVYLEGLILDVTDQVQAEEAFRQRNRELEMLNRVITTATSTLDAEQVLEVACKELARTLQLPQAAAALLNADGTEVTVVAEYLTSGRPSALGKTIPLTGNPATQYVLEHGAPLAVTDARKDDRMTAVHGLMRERGTVSLLIVPIVVARGRVAGTLGLDAIEWREFSQEEIALAQSVAAAAGQALETARLYQALRRNVERLEETVAQRTIELREALDRAKDADRVKSEFVSNVSHELRSPLTNIKLYLSLLNRGRPEKRASYLDTLQRETDRLEDLIEGLLDISRLDLGKTQANLQPSNLNLLVGTLADDRRALVADRGLSLSVDLEEELPLAFADPKLLEQVLTNLLTNAVHYTPVGGTVTLRTGRAETGDVMWVTASVGDTGPGISEDDRQHLFERFYRGEAGRASGAPGTGLGLAICREIVDRHNGQITVESWVGQGSTFTVWLPLAP